MIRQLTNNNAKLSLTSAPTVGDRTREGKLWVKKDTNEVYVLLDVTAGVATWDKLVTASGYLPMDIMTNPALDAALTTAKLDAFSGIIILTTGAGNDQTFGAPSVVTPGKRYWVVNDDSSSHSFDVIGARTITIDPGEAEQYMWDGTAWIHITAADAKDITFNPATSYIASTNVQDAIDTFAPTTAGIAEANRAVALDANGNLDFSGGTLSNVNIPANYGVSWDESADTYARTGMLAGIATGLSPSIPLPIHEGMKRCVLDDSGNVLYFLDPNDSTLKADGSAATIDDQSVGNVMVQIPKFWYKYSYAGTTHTWNISTVPMDGYTVHPAFIKNGAEVEFRYAGAYEGSLFDASAGAMVASADIVTSLYAAGDKLCSLSGEYPKVNETRAENRGAASQRGAGWRNMDFDLMSAVQLLYLTEYADFDSQVMIGVGRTALSGGTWVADSYIGQCGKSNAVGNGTNSVGGNSNNAYMTYRGIENIFGNVWEFIDGFNVNNNIPYVSNTDTEFADDTATNYAALGVVLANANGYQDTLEQIRRGFLPASVGASSSTKITDYYYQAAGWRVLLFGGHAYNGSIAGVFCVNADIASSSYGVNVGARLCF